MFSWPGHATALRLVFIRKSPDAFEPMNIRVICSKFRITKLSPILISKTSLRFPKQPNI